MARRFRIPFFRIFYSTTYTSLFFVLLVLLAITPASLIYTAVEASAPQYIFMIGGVYVLTALFTLFIYSSRLYTNRSVLAAVGKSYLPVQDGEVSKNVRKTVVRSLERSALIAWESRPRDLARGIASKDAVAGNQQERDGLMSPDDSLLAGRIVKVDTYSPPWGHVQHPGWSSPSEMDTSVQTHIYFSSVVQELPNLIEAHAVSLAAVTKSPEGDMAALSSPDIAALQRSPMTGLRTYLTRLDTLDLVTIPSSADHFLSLYEFARFSGIPLNEPQFKALMTAFADLLAGMQPVIRMNESFPLQEGIGDYGHAVPRFMTSTESFTSLDSQQSAIHHHHPRGTSPLPVPGTSPDMYLTPGQTPVRSTSLRHQSSSGSVLRSSPPQVVDYDSRSSSSMHSSDSVIRSGTMQRNGGQPFEWMQDGG
ncbi:hypothetical protein MBLNU457_6630t1 [Dothideomycetes sp. NU457]